MSIVRYFKQSIMLPFPSDIGIRDYAIKEANDPVQKEFDHLIGTKISAHPQEMHSLH